MSDNILPHESLRKRRQVPEQRPAPFESDVSRRKTRYDCFLSVMIFLTLCLMAVLGLLRLLGGA